MGLKKKKRKNSKAKPTKKKKNFKKKNFKKRYKVKRNVYDNYRCELIICRHEKCHHCKFITFLQKQKKKYNINFFASVLPYNQIFHPVKYGIIKGIPDFFIPLKCREYNGLYIELKVGGGILTDSEKIEIRKIIDKGESMVGVCYGWKDCKELMVAYRNKQSNEKLEKLCWKGKTKKNF